MVSENKNRIRDKVYENIKKVLVFIFVLQFAMGTFAAELSDNDGSAFITKAEFDSLKNNFQAQIDQYNQSIDSKIDGAIAAYLSGINLSSEIELENMYAILESNVTGGKILWSSKATCDYNKFEYTNLGYKFDIRESYMSNPSSNNTWKVNGLNYSAVLFDWPIPNIVTYGGGYEMTDQKATIDIVGDEICFNEYTYPITSYACYFPQSSEDGRVSNIGLYVTSIMDDCRLCTTFMSTMMWIYDCDCKVVTSKSPYYLLEPNNNEVIYTFDSKKGYKTFDYPSAFKTSTKIGTNGILSGLSRDWTVPSTDLSIDEAWRDVAPDAVQKNHYGTDSDFDYNNVKCRMHNWVRTSGYYTWNDTSYFANYTVKKDFTKTYHPGAVYFKNYGEHKAVNELVISAPREKYGIYSKISDGFPVLKMAKKGTFEFKVKSDKNGQLVVQNIGEGTATHTTTTVTTVSLIGGATTAETISGLADADDVIVVKFLPTSTTDQARLTITDTKETMEE